MGDKTVVLAIDDNAAELKAIQSLLSEQYDVRIAKSVPDAMGILETVKIDAFLLDIEMPNISGFEFLHDIRKNPVYMNAPIIIVSGHAEPEFMETAKNSSADDIITKPVTAEMLIKAIKKAAEKSSVTTNPYGL
jgi:CheY-like chemotaxis protein